MLQKNNIKSSTNTYVHERKEKSIHQRQLRRAVIAAAISSVAILIGIMYPNNSPIINKTEEDSPILDVKIQNERVALREKIQLLCSEHNAKAFDAQAQTIDHINRQRQHWIAKHDSTIAQYKQNKANYLSEQETREQVSRNLQMTNDNELKENNENKTKATLVYAKKLMHEKIKYKHDQEEKNHAAENNFKLAVKATKTRWRSRREGIGRLKRSLETNQNTKQLLQQEDAG